MDRRNIKRDLTARVVLSIALLLFYNSVVAASPLLPQVSLPTGEGRGGAVGFEGASQDSARLRLTYERLARAGRYTGTIQSPACTTYIEDFV